VFKSIFSKLIAVFIAILLVGFSVTGILLYYFLSDYVLEEKLELMEQSGRTVVTLLEGNIQNFDNLLFTLSMRIFFESYRENYQLYIWLVDREGRIILTENVQADRAIPGEILKKMKIQSGYYSLPDKRQYEQIMSGNRNILIEEGFFYGLFELTKVPWMTVQIPVSYNGEVIAAVYVNTPIPEVQKARTSVFRFFIISIFVSIVISTVLVYIFSRRLSKPLKQMRDAARVIAGGEFDKRINMESRDEIGELARSFNQMVTDLQNLEEMRKGFIANVSHELRTPMTTILGFVEGILDGTIQADKQGDYLTIVRDEIHRLSRLVDDLLHLARMEAGELQLALRDFDINELIRLSIIKLETLIVQKGIEVEADFMEEKTMVHADADAIQRVLLNLLHNAVKFTPEKGKIKVFIGSMSKGRITVSVEDNGFGIDSSEIGRIWERFYKSDKSRGKDRSGTGLGLAIIKNIINWHNQEIWVESKHGQGTRFTFTLNRSR
jgi:signal transduction histidine kinase